MRKIENAQKELCEYLISIMPVEWKKICFYSKCTSGSRTTWIALVEKETGAICTQESFGDRYNEYPCKKMDVYIKLGKLIKNLYNAYIEKFGEEKIWYTYSLTIEDDYSFHVDLGYEMPEGNLVEQHDKVFRDFFNEEYQYLEGKYPY
ncbi:MAG: DUF600 family protein [Ruminococcus sp.]|nr:DUF600 family protein [Ruminococcus sp.]